MQPINTSPLVLATGINHLGDFTRHPIRTDRNQFSIAARIAIQYTVKNHVVQYLVKHLQMTTAHFKSSNLFALDFVPLIVRSPSHRAHNHRA